MGNEAGLRLRFFRARQKACDAYQMHEWQNFYVILGSAAAALVGIQFVVITLIGNRADQQQEDAINAFGTPTVVHLATVLLISATMTAPWPSRAQAALGVAGCSVAGLAYCFLATVRALRQTVYQPTWEDWLWYSIVPCSLYAALGGSAVALRTHPAALFFIGAWALGLVLTAIHNAWDTVTYLVLSRPDPKQTQTAGTANRPEPGTGGGHAGSSKINGAGAAH